MLPTYLVALGSFAFAAISALTWIYAVRHFDPPQDAEKPADTAVKTAA
jgi:hypothetical protein